MHNRDMYCYNSISGELLEATSRICIHLLKDWWNSRLVANYLGEKIVLKFKFERKECWNYEWNLEKETINKNVIKHKRGLKSVELETNNNEEEDEIDVFFTLKQKSSNSYFTK